MGTASETAQPKKGGMGRTIAVAVVVIVVIALVAGYYFLSGGMGGSNTASVTIASGTGSNQSLNFNPSSVSARATVVVTFTNNDNTAHTITFTSGPAGVALGTLSDSNLAPGASYSVTLTVPGTYQYHCTIHSWMSGSITVQ